MALQEQIKDLQKDLEKYTNLVKDSEQNINRLMKDKEGKVNADEALAIIHRVDVLNHPFQEEGKHVRLLREDYYRELDSKYNLYK